MIANLANNYHFWEAMIVVIPLAFIVFVIVLYCLMFWGDL